MDNNTRHQIKEYLMDYLKKTVPGFTKKGKMITCPFQQKHAKPDELSANIYPENSNKVHCFDPNCNYKGDIFDICRQLEFEGDVDVTDDDIGNYLTNEFKITTDNTLDKLFDGYVEKKWCMVPVEKNQKESWIEKEWHLKDHYEKTEWFDWIYAKRNLGVQTGKKSNMFILDIDAMPKAIKDKIYEKKASKKEIDDAIILRDENIQKVYKVL
ncbi:MAG: hypothetical protein M0R03_08875, partial [Novosphingobium sp.]|nr:hypothetical protein [Novosphingobium sp.]